MMAGTIRRSNNKAVMVLLTMSLVSHGLGDPAVAAVALTVSFEGAAIFFFSEVRPIGGSDVPLRISCLPDQKIADAQLARSADDEVGVGHAGSIEILIDQLIRDLLGLDAVPHHLLDGLDDFVASAVVPGDVQDEAVIVLGQLHGLQDLFLEL